MAEQTSPQLRFPRRRNPTRRESGVGGDPRTGRLLRLCLPGDELDQRDPILVIDDDPQVRRMIGRILAEDNHEIDLAASSKAALERVGRRRFALAICDVQFSEVGGIDLACQLRRIQPDLGILMVSDDDNPRLAILAAERGGAACYLVKPFTPNELRINVSNTLLRCRLERVAAANEERLRLAVEERTQELQAAIGGLLASREATIRHLSKAVEMRDPTTHAHIDRIGEISALLARAVGWAETDVELLRIAAPMHDVGKIGIPDRILLKPGPLTLHERAEMERHTLIGHEILSGSDSSLLNLAATVALTHHERFDGRGYPRRLRGVQIPEAGRIVAVADVFDALVNDRVYRPALPLREAVRMMRHGRGTQFDAGVLEALFDHLEEALLVQRASAGRSRGRGSGL
jgi:response regulator RpfG family c-di-GMP phosphodiesterase